jgi:hypothetical protein
MLYDTAKRYQFHASKKIKLDLSYTRPNLRSRLLSISYMLFNINGLAEDIKFRFLHLVLTELSVCLTVFFLTRAFLFLCACQ